MLKVTKLPCNEEESLHECENFRQCENEPQPKSQMVSNNTTQTYESEALHQAKKMIHSKKFRM